MLTDVSTVPPFLVSENTAVPAELDARVRRLGRGGGVAVGVFFFWTVIGPKLAASMTPLQRPRTI